MNRKYSPDMRERALRMLAETRPSHPTMMSAVRHMAGLLGMSPETLRLWQRRYEVDAGAKPGLTTDAAAEIKRLQKENAELRKPTRSSRLRACFSRRSSTTPDRDDPVRFTAPAPRRLWVCAVTYVATWSGFAYVAFVTDVYSRRIVGWNVASTLRSEILPIPALDMAAWNVGGRLDGLIHHVDHGSNYTAMVYTEQIVELGAVPSTGTVGDSFDNAMAEAVNNLYKTALIRQQGPWRLVEQVELATLEWVWWWNNSRLHGELDLRTPAEVEDAYYADQESANPAAAGQGSR